MIAVRLPLELENRIRTEAETKGKTVTSIIKAAVESYIYVDDATDWKLTASNIFQIDVIKIDYALERARHVGEFAAYLASWNKSLSITVLPHAESYTVQMILNKKTIPVNISRGQSKEAACAYLVEQLEEKLADDFDLEGIA